MTAKKTKTRRVSGKATARKPAARGAPERPGESIVDAARRLWLSAQSLITASGETRRKSRREGKVSR